MGSLGPPHLLVLLFAVAVIAAACGFATSTAMRRNTRHARRVFLLGALCGFMAGAILPRWRGGRNALVRAGARSFAAPNLHLPSWPPQRRRPARRVPWRARR